MILADWIARAISAQLNEYLRNHNMTGDAFARAAGLHPNTITNCRAGRAVPTLPNALAMAQVMGISLDALVGRHDEG